MGSGYGSVSRTVEEIILAFDFTYNMVKESLRALVNKAKQSETSSTIAEKDVLWAALVSTMWNIDNAISRLNKAKPLPQK